MSRVSGGNLLARWTHLVSERSDFSLQLYYDRTHLFDPIGALALGGRPIAPAGLLTDDLDTYDIDFQHRFGLGERHRLTWGLGSRRTEDVLHNAPAVAFLPARLNQNLYSGFVQDDIALRDSLYLTLGTKVEHNDYTGWEYEPSARLRWHPAEDRTVWAAVSRAVRAPSRIDRDLYEPAPSYTPLVLSGSPDFDSETVIAYELGYRAQLGPRWSASLAAFYNDYDRVRSLRATPTTILPLYFANDLEGTTHGIEISADGKLCDGWRVHIGYSPLWEDIKVKAGRMDINQGRNETADPHQRLTLRTSLDLPHGVELDAALRRISTRELNSGQTIGRIPAFWDMDLRLGWRPRDGLEISLSGRHVLHAHQTEYGFPNSSQVAIGRSVFGKIVWQF
jgi:iron complex outermembrane receptor protein